MRPKNNWTRRIRQMWALYAIAEMLGFIPSYLFYIENKRKRLPDQWEEDFKDATGCYCMGGEL